MPTLPRFLSAVSAPRLHQTLAALLFTGCTLATAAPLPEGPRVLAGKATLDASVPGRLTVIQQTPELTLQWQSFDIARDRAVVFVQGPGDRVVNQVAEVAGSRGSRIEGALRGAGQVVLEDARGLSLGRGSRVEAGSFLARAGAGSAAPTAALISQGVIEASPGGQVVLENRATRGSVRQEGLIHGAGGTVRLQAAQGEVLAGGRIDVSGPEGGQVYILGDQTVTVSGTLEASGEARAGAIHVGGENGVIQAALTRVTGGGVLRAEARGAGDGGQVETLGQRLDLAPTLRVSTLAQAGRVGNWLIDPHNLTISNAPSSGFSGFNANADDAVINVNTVQSALASTSITVSTGSSGSQAGDITVLAPITWSANTTLTLAAANNIVIGRDITATGATAGLNLQYGGAYQLRNGARVTLSGSGATFTTPAGSFTLIHNLSQLAGVSTSLVALAEDIDAQATATQNGGQGFVPLTFTGEFHGLGHAIQALTINRPGTFAQALIGDLSGTLRDLTLANVAVTGLVRVGGAVGFLSGYSTVSNVHVTGSVTGANDQVGGLAGLFDIGAVQECSSAAAVTGQNEVGGLIGRLRISTVTDSYATGTVAASGNYAGGLVGSVYDDATLTRVYASGGVSGGLQVGGLVGGSMYPGTQTATNAYWDSATTGQGSSYLGQALVPASVLSQAGYLGFDFTNTWVLFAGETRPLLRGEGGTVIHTPHTLQLALLDLTGSYTQGGKLDLATPLASAGDVWGSAGFLSLGNNATAFTGRYDGQGFPLIGLRIQRGATNYVGLFGTTNGAQLSRIVLQGGTVTGNAEVGALVGRQIGGAIANARTSVNVTGLSTVAGEIGGLVGYVDGGSVSDAVSTGSVTGAGFDVGGVIGFLGNGATLTHSYATGSVTSNGTQGYVGGLVGANGYTSSDGGTITESYATASVISPVGPVGGLVGHNEGAILDAYATGPVTYTGSSGWAGTLVGVNFVHGTITRAYGAGVVSGNNAGALAGYNNNAASAITASFGDTQASGKSSAVAGGSSGSGAQGLNTAAMQTLSTYTAGGVAWNVDALAGSGKTWRIYPGATYPLLRYFLSPLSVSFTGATRVYDGTTVGTTATYQTVPSPAQVGGILGSLRYTTAKDVGSYSTAASNLVLGGLYSHQQGYDIQYGSGDASITRAPLSIVANNATKAYDGSAFSGGNGVTFQTLAPGDSAADFGGTLTYGGSAQGAVAVGHYTLVPGGLTSGNYQISYVAGDLSIFLPAFTAGASLTGAGSLSATSQGVSYGGTASFTLSPDAGYRPRTTVGGNCPAGSWSGNTYTTGSVTGDCTVSFGLDPITSLSGLVLPNGAGTASVAIQGANATYVSTCRIISWQFDAAPGTLPAGAGSFPLGLAHFTLRGCGSGQGVQVTVNYPRSVDGMAYWKWTGSNWLSLPATLSGATASFTLVDGGSFDLDGLANNEITDPSGPSASATGVQEVPGLGRPGLLLLALLLLGFIWRQPLRGPRRRA